MSLLFLPPRSPAHAQVCPPGAALGLRVLVADADRVARARLCAAVLRDSRFDLVGEAADGVEALNRIERLMPDVVLMAMAMPRLNGREVIEALGGSRDFALVFTADSRGRGVRALHAQAADYLEFGADDARLKRALDRARAQCLRHGSAREANPEEACSQLTVKTVDGVWLTLSACDIVRITAAQRHAHIRTQHGDYVVRKTLRELASRLGAEFVRVRRNELINARRIPNSAGF